jgi:hypothetical protein
LHRGCKSELHQVFATDTWPESRPLGGNPQFLVMMDASNGKVIQSFPITAGVDADVFEPETDLVFVSTREGMLHIFHEDSADNLSEVQTFKTEYGVKTMAMDPKTRNIFLSTSDFDPPGPPTEKQPRPNPRAKQGNFRVPVLGADFDRQARR